MKKDKNLYNKNLAKKEVIKYIVILLVFLPILVLLNFTILKNLGSFLRIVIDVLLSLGFVYIAKSVIDKVQASREKKRELKAEQEKKRERALRKQEKQEKQGVKPLEMGEERSIENGDKDNATQ